MSVNADAGTAALYADVVAEVRVRVLSIVELANRADVLPGQLIREYGFLQLRMCCELIAIGCLIAHGDMPATRVNSLLKAYSPKDILSKLEKLNSRFYPRPRVKELAGDILMYFDFTDPYLTKDDLLSLYGLCGDQLHRNAKKVEARSLDKTRDFHDLVDHGQKIINLLNIHTLERPGELRLICEFNEDGPVVVTRPSPLSGEA